MTMYPDDEPSASFMRQRRLKTLENPCFAKLCTTELESYPQNRLQVTFAVTFC